MDALNVILGEIRGLEDSNDFNESSIQQIFDISYRNSFWGCCRKFVHESDVEGLKYAFTVVKKITSTQNAAIIKAIFQSKIQEDFKAVIMSGKAGGENSTAVKLAFQCLANMYSENQEEIEAIVKDNELKKIVDMAIGYKDDSEIAQGFLQFMCAMISTKYWPVKEFINQQVLDLLMKCLNDRSADLVETITDGMAIVEFLTDIRDGEDEKPYATIILYLIDAGFYQVSLDALSDEHIASKLGILCARTLGNALTLDKYPEIDTVEFIHEENIQPSRVYEHMFQCCSAKHKPVVGQRSHLAALQPLL